MTIASASNDLGTRLTIRSFGTSGRNGEVALVQIEWWDKFDGSRYITVERPLLLAALGGDQAAREPNTSGPWDMGDPDPGPTVTEVVDEIGTVDNLWGGDQAEWHRTSGGDWKGYKDGGKTYLSWAELLRRWGPVRLRNADDQR